MNTQNQIKRVLSRDENITHIRLLISDNPDICRTHLAERICDDFSFFDGKGKRQRSGCLKVLRELAAAGRLDLPAPQRKGSSKTPRRLGEAVASAVGVPASVEDVQGLRLTLVESVMQMRIWNELMLREHPWGAGPLVGRQLYYLIESEHGILGALGYASAALSVADRDAWIGWDAETRLNHLQRVTGLARFLIRNDVSCRNLASSVLAMAAGRMPDDFEKQYGYHPWLLESFVDGGSFSGASYRAANWIHVGCTKGRGRQDRHTRRAETIKEIYVYPLVADFRDRMGIPADRGPAPLQPLEGVDGDSWAEQEFGGAPLGDRRLGKRLVDSADQIMKSPGRAFAGAVNGDKAMIKGYYRFIESPDTSAVTMENILLPHRQTTVRRMKAQDVALCIQDGSDLNYNNLEQCEGLGTLSKNQTGAKSKGLQLHSTLSVSGDGIPLGILNAQISAPEPVSKERRRHADIPIEEKQTFSWIKGYRDCVEVARTIPDTRVVCVMDREADIFEMFDEQRRQPEADLLIRAKHNRCIANGGKLFDTIRTAPVRQRLTFPVPRQSARPKKSKQKARPKRDERVAHVAVRYKEIELRPPENQVDKTPVKVSIVHICEEHPPSGAVAVEWFLLTTIKIDSPEMARLCVKWYRLRWRIEDFHRVLKSGCKIEGMAHKTAERLRRAIAINMVVAWRIMVMTLLGRETPDLPMEIAFTDAEVKVLRAYAQKKNGMTPPSTIGEAVLIVAMLGGYIQRGNGPPPGYQVMWHGFSLLQGMVIGYELQI